MYAAKVISMATDEQRALALYEYEMLRQLTHPRILSLVDAFDRGHDAVLITEL